MNTVRWSQSKSDRVTNKIHKLLDKKNAMWEEYIEKRRIFTLEHPEIRRLDYEITEIENDLEELITEAHQLIEAKRCMYDDEF